MYKINTVLQDIIAQYILTSRAPIDLTWGKLKMAAIYRKMTAATNHVTCISYVLSTGVYLCRIYLL